MNNIESTRTYKGYTIIREWHYPTYSSRMYNVYVIGDEPEFGKGMWATIFDSIAEAKRAINACIQRKAQESDPHAMRLQNLYRSRK